MFNYPARAKQLIDYDDLADGKVRPTDIDGLIEYDDTYYVFLEYKLNGKKLDMGQRLAIERLVKNLIKAKKKAVALICDHDVKDPEKNVKGGSAIVREAYHGVKWNKATCRITVAEYCERFIDGFKPNRR